MVYMKLIVALGCLAATTLARPALPPSEAELVGSSHRPLTLRGPIPSVGCTPMRWLHD